MDLFVKRILNEWNLGHLVETFREEAIDQEAFTTLTPDIIKELIPKLGYRSKFLNKFNEWKEKPVQEKKAEIENPPKEKKRKKSPHLLSTEPQHLTKVELIIEDVKQPCNENGIAVKTESMDIPIATRVSRTRSGQFGKQPPKSEIVPNPEKIIVDLAAKIRSYLEEDFVSKKWLRKKSLDEMDRKLFVHKLTKLILAEEPTQNNETIEKWSKAVPLVFPEEKSPLYYKKKHSHSYGKLIDKWRSEKAIFSKTGEYTKDGGGSKKLYTEPLKKTLLSSVETFHLINNKSKTSELDEVARKAISKVLLTHLLDHNQNLTMIELHYWAEAIICIFPKEIITVWYNPYASCKRGHLVKSFYAIKNLSSLTNHVLPPTPVITESEEDKPILDFTANYQDELKNILASSDRTFTYLRDGTELDKHGRAMIAKTLVDHLLGLTEEEAPMVKLKLWAVAITQVFPKEKLEDWYNPKTPNSRGKLVVQYKYSMPPKVKVMSIKVQKNHPIIITNPDVVAEMSPENSLVPIVVLEDVSQVEPTLVEWRLTLNSRLAFRKMYDIKKYLETYSNLTAKDGYKYISYDFDSMYPLAVYSFNCNWPTFAKRLLKLAVEKELIEGFDDNLAEQYPTIVENTAFVLLPLLYDYPLEVSKNALCQPTKEDISMNFITYSNDMEQIHEITKQRQQYLETYNLSKTPSILAFGESITEMALIEVHFEDIFYEVQSLKEAVILCIKIFLMLDMKANEITFFPWIFLIKYVMGINTKSDLSFSKSNEILYQKLLQTQ